MIIAIKKVACLVLLSSLTIGCSSNDDDDDFAVDGGPGGPVA